MVDDIDRHLVARLQQDATTPYAALGEAVGLSTAAVHDRVRKLKERGVIRRSTVDVDEAALGRGVLAFVQLEADRWMGEAATAQALAAVTEVLEAHVIAGPATILTKVRATSTADLQAVLRKLHAVDGVTRTRTMVVLDTFFERPVDPR